MTKRYDIVYISDEMYMIDKENKLSHGDWFIKNNKEVDKVDLSTDWAYLDEPKILASSDKSLNLPLLPVVELNLHKLGCEIAFKNGYNTENKANTDKFYDGVSEFLEGFTLGYKINTKEYTIADIEAAVAFGVALERLRSTRTFSDEEEFKGFLEGLKPKPKFVWIEVENDLPLIEKGYVKVNKWDF